MRGEDLLDQVEKRLLAVNLDRARLAAQAMALRTARLRLSTGVAPKIVAAELETDPSRPLEEVSHGPVEAVGISPHPSVPPLPDRVGL